MTYSCTHPRAARVTRSIPLAPPAAMIPQAEVQDGLRIRTKNTYIVELGLLLGTAFRVGADTVTGTLVGLKPPPRRGNAEYYGTLMRSTRIAITARGPPRPRCRLNTTRAAPLGAPAASPSRFRRSPLRRSPTPFHPIRR